MLKARMCGMGVFAAGGKAAAGSSGRYANDVEELLMVDCGIPASMTSPGSGRCGFLCPPPYMAEALVAAMYNPWYAATRHRLSLPPLAAA